MEQRQAWRPHLCINKSQQAQTLQPCKICLQVLHFTRGVELLVNLQVNQILTAVLKAVHQVKLCPIPYPVALGLPAEKALYLETQGQPQTELASVSQTRTVQRFV